MIFRRKKKTRRPSTFARPSYASRRSRGRRRTPGRTLTATSNSTKKESRRTSRQKRQSLRGVKGFFTKAKRPFFLVVIGAMLISITNYLFISSTLNITTIQIIEDGEENKNHDVQTLLQEFENSNILLFKTGDIEAYLRDLYPEYETFSITKQLPDTLVVTLQRYAEVANLVVMTPDETETIYLLNTAGTTTQGNLDEKLEDFPTIFIEKEQSITVGTNVISQENLAFVLEAIQNYEDKFGMQVLWAEYLDAAREVHLWTENNFYVWLDITADLDTQLNKLKKSLTKLNIYETDLEYIDLRISGLNGEKIIYKPR